MARRYFYHLTDGTSLILDEKGRWTRSKRMIEPTALSRAFALMRRGSAQVDWSEWLVSVQDGQGSMVQVVPFPANDV